MAISLGKVNVQDLVQNKPKILGIGINRNSTTDGIFAVNYSTIKQYKDNLINLVLTKKGERCMQPNFGCDIWNVLFEQIIDDEIVDKIEDAVRTAAKIWIPDVLIEEINVDTNDELKDTNTVNVSIRFSLVSNPNISDTIDLTIK